MTPAQQKAYYAKNKADAKVKEDKALYEITGSRGDAARKGMEEGRMDAMGTAYKKGGKVMKKMKKYEDGGEVEFETKQGKNEGSSIDEGVRARAMAAMEKGSSDTSAVPKKTAAKLTPKAEAPTPKAEPKAEPKAKADSLQQLKDVVKGKDVTAPSTKSFTEAGGNTKATNKKEDLSGFSFSNVAKKLREKAGITSYKSGGSVRSSASKRADGCAIRGKTRA